MSKKDAFRGHALKGAWVAAMIFEHPRSAQTDQFGIQVAVGVGDRHVNLGVAWDPNLTWWQIGDGHFSLIGEAHVAWWHTHEGDVH
jgi:lipid A 3-O-deacylase